MRVVLAQVKAYFRQYNNVVFRIFDGGRYAYVVFLVGIRDMGRGVVIVVDVSFLFLVSQVVYQLVQQFYAASGRVTR